MKMIVLMVFVFGANLLFAQKVVTGTITDDQRKPILGSLISVVDTNVNTQTDSLGRYRIEVPKGFVVLRVEKEGYGFKEVAIEKNVINVSLSSAVKLTELGLEDLMNIKVITATRQLTKIDKSPSPITVITAAQIQQRGYKTIEEILQTVPGFFTGHAVAQALIMNRGIAQDQNVNYLLLIDGHAQNSISVYGMDQQHIYPFLGNVKQIEIIRGPASTLWGSDALMGIINIITKEAKDVDDETHRLGGISVSIDHQIRDHQPVASLQYAKQFNKKTNLILSYMGTKSDGDIQKIITPYLYKTNEPMPYKGNGWVDTYNQIPLSQEIYLKSKINNFSVLARFSDQNILSPWATPLDGSFKPNRKWQQGFVETRYEKQLTNEWSIDAKIFYDKIYNRFDYNRLNPTKNMATYGIYADEQGLGAECLAHYVKKHVNILFGLKDVYRDANDSKIYYTTDTTWSRYQLFKGAKDMTNSLFGEVKYDGIKNLIFIAGLRGEKNNYRDVDIALLPRASIIYSLNEKWMMKYMFNTGIMRPTLTYLRKDPLTWQYNVTPTTVSYGTDKSQKTYSNDLQIVYKGKRLQLTTTLFYTVLNNFTTWAPISNVASASMNPLTTKGVEFEFLGEVSKSVSFFGNISYSFAKYKNSNVYSSVSNTPYILDPNNPACNFLMTTDFKALGPPKLLWNLSVDIKVPKLFTACLHYRGWADETVRWGNNGTEGLKKLGPEHYLDLNLLKKNVFVKNLDMSVYVKNVLDNQNYVIGLPYLFAKYYGRAIGASISYHF